MWRPLQGQRDERTAQVAAAALADAATAKVRHMHLRTSRVWSIGCSDRIPLVETLCQQKVFFNRKAAFQQKDCFNIKVGRGFTDTNDDGYSSSLLVSVPLCFVRLARSGAEQGLAHAMALNVQLLRPHPFVSAITAYRIRHKRTSQTLLNPLCLGGAGAGQGLAHAVGGGRGARRRAAALAAPAPSWR